MAAIKLIKPASLNKTLFNVRNRRNKRASRELDDLQMISSLPKPLIPPVNTSISCDNVSAIHIDSNPTHSPSSTTPESELTHSACSSNNTLFNSEIHRLLSFLDNMSFELAFALAKNGYYFISNESLACCHFCHHEIEGPCTETNFEQHLCDQRDNIALPSDKSNYHYEANRIISFLAIGWEKQASVKYPVGALELASNGFYYAGRADVARCAFCRLEIQGWEPEDIAESEHRHWNPSCNFLNGASVGNVKLGAETSSNNANDSSVCLSQNNNVDELLRKENLGVIKISPSTHPDYASVTSRLCSYRTWPASMRQRPEQLCEAGFYYTGKGDRVICFQCGGGLKDWSHTDLPWVEHATWFPHCSHLIMKKGADFIQQVQRLKQEQTTPEPVPEKLVEMVFENKLATTSEIPDARQCKVCLDKELGVVFLPCGHIAACADCAPRLPCCPVCRRPISAFIRAFLP